MRPLIIGLWLALAPACSAARKATAGSQRSAFGMETTRFRSKVIVTCCRHRLLLLEYSIQLGKRWSATHSVVFVGQRRRMLCSRNLRMLQTFYVSFRHGRLHRHPEANAYPAMLAR